MFGLVEHHGTCACSARAAAADPPPPAQGGGGETPAEHPAGQPPHFPINHRYREIAPSLSVANKSF